MQSKNVITISVAVYVNLMVNNVTQSKIVIAIRVDLSVKSNNTLCMGRRLCLENQYICL